MNGGALLSGDLVGLAWIVEMFVHACKPSCFFQKKNSLCRVELSASPVRRLLGVCWALAVEIRFFFLLFFGGWVGGLGVCNNRVFAVSVWFISKDGFVSFIHYHLFLVLVLARFWLCYPFCRPLYRRIVIVYYVKSFQDLHVCPGGRVIPSSTLI